MELLDEQIEKAARLVQSAQSIIAFSGAGMSTESGLSDFRSPGGLWERYRTVTHPEFLRSESARKEYWEMRRELIPMILGARPNSGHNALVALEPRLTGVVTQNIDGLHQEAGSSNVIELHGTNRTASCLSCGSRWKIEEIQVKLEDGDLDPHCSCGGLINPDTVSFGQSMPEDAMRKAFSAARSCDLMLMLGSSLNVQPAASVPVLAHQSGATLIFCNCTSTEYDSTASMLVRSSISDFLAEVVARCNF